jgi:hypothetical protein
MPNYCIVYTLSVDESMNMNHQEHVGFLNETANSFKIQIKKMQARTTLKDLGVVVCLNGSG